MLEVGKIQEGDWYWNHWLLAGNESQENEI